MLVYDSIPPIPVHDSLSSSPTLTPVPPPQAQYLCDYILNGGSRDAFMKKFAPATSPGFNPDTMLVNVREGGEMWLGNMWLLGAWG